MGLKTAEGGDHAHHDVERGRLLGRWLALGHQVDGLPFLVGAHRIAGHSGQSRPSMFRYSTGQATKNLVRTRMHGSVGRRELLAPSAPIRAGVGFGGLASVSLVHPTASLMNDVAQHLRPTNPYPPSGL